VILSKLSGGETNLAYASAIAFMVIPKIVAVQPSIPTAMSVTATPENSATVSAIAFCTGFSGLS
jgi:hypothetical protein